MDFIYVIIIGIAAGFLAAWLLKGSGFGWLVNLIIGVAGSFMGHWLFAYLGISLGPGIFGTLITATIGAVVLLFIINIFKR